MKCVVKMAVLWVQILLRGRGHEGEGDNTDLLGRIQISKRTAPSSRKHTRSIRVNRNPGDSNGSFMSLDLGCDVP